MGNNSKQDGDSHQVKYVPTIIRPENLKNRERNERDI